MIPRGRLLLLPLLLGLLAGCGPKLTEIARVTNPDGTIDAVTAREGARPTDRSPTDLVLVPKGQPAAGEPVLSLGRARDLAVTWTAPDRLAIRAKADRIHAIADRATVRVAGRDVTVAIDVRILQGPG